MVRGDNHSEDNLQAVCSACHKKKTQTEAKKASAAKRARRHTPLLRMLETIECR
ncbi:MULTISPECIES: HNH endonuclease [Corynebacterium]|uniref:HNH endonuclease n=1 Tax=Corynebacterium TaxID=1716 RepID=UPI001FED2C31|nr:MULTISPECIES: HNH endonuclease [Corynebacterium]MEB2596599.1 HNH endonuclease [Corynebacterium amycolatum]